MYARLISFLLLLLLASPVLGQTTDLFSSKVYKQNSLSVDLSGLQVSTDSGNDLQLACTICWSPYKGYERLTEAEFFRVAGFDQLAQQAQRHRRNKFIAMGIGGLSIIAGAVLVSNNISLDGTDTPRPGSSFVGVLLIGGGGATVGYSAMKLRTRSVPYAIAQDVAFEYNSQLQAELDSGQ